ncbi:transmembrane protein, putative [Medicago truncatula]|uniref:Transmembrane protein, putative n=1 Tax=Medicago truncatula TaxID=3880 RepID=A0A072UL61_MEDTR|nr:transmembrane protein, putative [Medicago truncatula]
MTLASSTLQIRRHEYSGDVNIVILVIFVGMCTLPFYAINMDVFQFIDTPVYAKVKAQGFKSERACLKRIVGINEYAEIGNNDGA